MVLEMQTYNKNLNKNFNLDVYLKKNLQCEYDDLIT